MLLNGKDGGALMIQRRHGRITGRHRICKKRSEGAKEKQMKKGFSSYY
jgi:hypothetical protein